MAGASETKQIMGTGTAGTAESIVVIVFPSVNVGLSFYFWSVGCTFIRIMPEKVQELLNSPFMKSVNYCRMPNNQTGLTFKITL